MLGSGLIRKLAAVKARQAPATSFYGQGNIYGGTGPADRPSPQQFVPVSNVGYPLPKDWDLDRAIRDGYRACAWVYACIDRLAGAGSSVPWKVMRRKGKSWDKEEGHDYELLLTRPNKFMTGQFLVTFACQHLGLGGNALWKAVRLKTKRSRDFPDGPVAELFPMNPTLVSPVPTADGWLGGYGYITNAGSSKPEWFDPADVIHAMLPDPSNPMWGMAPLRAAAMTIDMDVKQLRWNAAAPDNGMVPSGAIIDTNLRTDQQLDEALEKLRARFAGTDRARTPMLFGNNVTWQPMGFTPVEMDWIESRRFSLMEICAVFGLLPSLFIPDAKYTNQDVAIKYMWENGARRLMRVIEEALNLKLFTLQQSRDWWITYDTSDIPQLQDDLGKRIENHARAVAAGVPPNVSFVMCELPVDPIVGGDAAWIDGRLQPVPDPNAEPAPLPEPPAQEPPTPPADGQGEPQQLPAAA